MAFPSEISHFFYAETWVSSGRKWNPGTRQTSHTCCQRGSNVVATKLDRHSSNKNAVRMKHPHGFSSISIVRRGAVHSDFREIDTRAGDVVHQISEEVFGYHSHDLYDLAVTESCATDRIQIDLRNLTTRFSHAFGKG